MITQFPRTLFAFHMRVAAAVSSAGNGWIRLPGGRARALPERGSVSRSAAMAG